MTLSDEEQQLIAELRSAEAFMVIWKTGEETMLDLLHQAEALLVKEGEVCGEHQHQATFIGCGKTLEEAMRGCPAAA